MNVSGNLWVILALPRNFLNGRSISFSKLRSGGRSTDTEDWPCQRSPILIPLPCSFLSLPFHSLPFPSFPFLSLLFPSFHLLPLLHHLFHLSPLLVFIFSPSAVVPFTFSVMFSSQTLSSPFSFTQIPYLFVLRHRSRTYSCPFLPLPSTFPSSSPIHSSFFFFTKHSSYFLPYFPINLAFPNVYITLTPHFSRPFLFNLPILPLLPSFHPSLPPSLPPSHILYPSLIFFLSPIQFFLSPIFHFLSYFFIFNESHLHSSFVVIINK